ncbi:ABC transporter substrate-binding protein [Marinobacter changyiensis]|uniref:ABC transporter substrate-binding protein n=1 Tax=Marinobacter changyiensis TaxID=2604091 RepID=UPI001265AAA7|nr:ABC transporter substrate-binding protein [Marinobacter changyiensis]
MNQITLSKLGRAILTTAVITAATNGAQAANVSDEVVRIGVMTDMSGLYAAQNGPGSVEAVKMAVEDFGGKVLGKPIEVISANHQNRADTASSLAREWFSDGKVDMIGNLGPSHTALAVVQRAEASNRIAISTGAATTKLTNDECTPNSVHYVYDTYAMANGTAHALVEQGKKTWTFITVDYVFGRDLERDAIAVVESNGGEVLSKLSHPLKTSDFTSQMLTAQASGAEVIALANAGGDTINAIMTASEFNITTSNQTVAALVLFLSDVHSLGLETAQGLMLTTAWYWDFSNETRKWSERFLERTNNMPSDAQAGDYSSTLHYLRAVEAAGTDEASAVMAKMKSMPINDMFATNGQIREDGRMVHDMYLAQVKTPAESKRMWDYFDIIATIPAEDAFQPISKGNCRLVTDTE